MGTCLEVVRQGSGDVVRGWQGRHTPLTGVAIVIAVVAVLVSGCSARLDVPQLESDLASQLAVREQVPVDQVSVSCPESAPLETGATFDCQATVVDRPVVLTVTALDGDGTVEWTAQTVPPDE
jgi:hypothetical protein